MHPGHRERGVYNPAEEAGGRRVSSHSSLGGTRRRSRRRRHRHRRRRHRHRRPQSRGGAARRTGIARAPHAQSISQPKGIFRPRPSRWNAAAQSLRTHHRPSRRPVRLVSDGRFLWDISAATAVRQPRRGWGKASEGGPGGTGGCSCKHTAATPPRRPRRGIRLRRQVRRRRQCCQVLCCPRREHRISAGVHILREQQGEPEVRYVTFRLNFHHFHRFELDLRGYIHVRGAAFSCLRLKLADIVLI